MLAIFATRLGFAIALALALPLRQAPAARSASR